MLSPLPDLNKPITVKTTRAKVNTAVTRGPKFAYANDLELKYEYALRQSSPSGLEKFKTAPYGDSWRKRDIIDKTIKTCFLSFIIIAFSSQRNIMRIVYDRDFTVSTFIIFVLPGVSRGRPPTITTRSPSETISICFAQSIAWVNRWSKSGWLSARTG